MDNTDVVDKVTEKRKTTELVYPNSSKSSFLGEDKQLELVYGIEGGMGFYKIKNKSQDSYQITINFQDDSIRSHISKPYSISDSSLFPPSESISNWDMKQWTTHEKLDKSEYNGIRFGWRTYKGEMQFRINSKNDTYADVSYYYDSDGPSTKSTIKVIPNGSSNWYPYKGGNIVTAINK